MGDGNPWKYEPRKASSGVPKPKHGWSENYAGFVEKDGKKIGKCPNDMRPGVPERLLNNGVDGTSAKSAHDKDWPENIYAVHEGVVYRAVPTRGGHSYHGFPAGDQRKVSGPVKDKILKQARQKDCEKQVKRWMRQHMDVPSL